MAIIICSECGKEISDKSKECIHCGNPLNFTNIQEISIKQTEKIQERTVPEVKKSNYSKIMIIIFLFLSIAVATVLFNNNMTLEKKKQAEILYNIYQDISNLSEQTGNSYFKKIVPYSNAKKWETDLMEVVLNTNYESSDSDNAIDLLKKIELDFETKTENAQKILPTQYRELLEMKEYINNFYYYALGINPIEFTFYTTGPIWIDNCKKYCLGDEYEELEISFLNEINKLR